MLRWFRTRARATALSVLWSMLTLAAGTAAPHAIDCADEPGTVVSPHDADGHTIGAFRSSDEPLHCVLCHWARAFSADGVRASRLIVQHACSLSRLTSLVQGTRTVERLNLAPRAPPA